MLIGMRIVPPRKSPCSSKNTTSACGRRLRATKGMATPIATAAAVYEIQ